MSIANNKNDLHTHHDSSTESLNEKGSLPKTAYVIFLSLILDLLGFTVILPLFPSLLEYYGLQDEGGLYHFLLSYVHSFRGLVGAPNTARWNSLLFGGLIGSLFSLLQFFSSPIFGSISDVYGRKPLLLISLVGIAVSYAVWIISRNFTIFFLARVIGGISKGNVSLCTTIATDVTSQRNRGRAMALIGIAFSIGFLIGPLIGAIFSHYARQSGHTFYTPPAVFAFSLAVSDFVFIAIFFKESLPKEKRTVVLSSKLNHLNQLINPVCLFKLSVVKTNENITSLRRIVLAYFLYLFCFAGLEFTLTFLFHNRFNYSSTKQGMMFCFTGVIMALTQGGYVRRVKPGSEKTKALQAIFIQVPSFIIMAFATNVFVMYFGLALYSFAAGVIVPCLTTVVSAYGSPSEKGTILGVFRSLGALARAFAPFVACTLYWSLGSKICYVLGGLGLLCPAYILLTTRVDHKYS